MAKQRNEGIEKFLRDISGGDSRNDAQTNGRCMNPPVGCGQVVNKLTDFRDALSRREYEISGCCQKCQDKLFSPTHRQFRR